MGTIVVFSINKDIEFTGNIPDAIYNEGIVNLNAANNRIITFNDMVSGDSGILDINGNCNIGLRGVTIPNGGVIQFNNKVENNIVNLHGGILKFGTYGESYGYFDSSVNFNVYGCIIDFQNNKINITNLGHVTLNSNNMQMKLDVDPANLKMDQIKVDLLVANGKAIKLSDINLLSSIDKVNFSLSPLACDITNSICKNLANSIEYTGQNVEKGGYQYSVNYDKETGMLNFTCLNCTVFDNKVGVVAPVAAQVGGYLLQLNSYEVAFENMDMYCLNGLEKCGKYDSKTVWSRSYSKFEKVPLNGGPKVSNTAYGSYSGIESWILSSGGKYVTVLGVYSGYNGSHQYYEGASIVQNGGTLGLVTMTYTGNWFSGVTANVGANGGKFGRNNLTMLMTGVASKTGYNYSIFQGKGFIQPNLLASYSVIKVFDYNDNGKNIVSRALHALQIELGLKIVGNLQNNWQPYFAGSFVWNILDKTHFQADNIALQDISVDSFVKYGVGVRKNWNNKFIGYLQTNVVNGGRNGVEIQIGLNWNLGK